MQSEQKDKKRNQIQIIRKLLNKLRIQRLKSIQKKTNGK